MIPTLSVAAPSAAAVMPMRRVLGAYWTEARYEIVRAMRTPMFAIPFLAIPILLYLFFAVVISGNGTRSADAPENLPILLLTGFSVMGVMGPGIFGFGVSIAMERDQGLTRLKRAQPMPPMAFLAAKMVMALLFSAVVAAAIGTLGLVVRGVPITPAQLAGMVLVESVGTLPFCAIGLFIGSRVTGRFAPAFANLIYLPLVYLSGLFFPLPEGIRWIALFSPAFHLNQLAQRVAGVSSVLSFPNAMHVAALVGVTVLFAGLALRNLSIEPAS
jgi:ABC-2 type transport system permease protein